MPITIQQLENIANQCLDYYFKDTKALAQAVQDKPLLKAMKSAQKTFPGGKGDLRGNVKGDYTTSFMGYSHDDPVTYGRPANVKQFNYPWKEIHAGLEVTLTALKNDGINVVDTLNGEKVEVTPNEETRITSFFEDQLDDLMEGSNKSYNEMLWRDGSQSAKVFPGILSIITDTPTAGVVGGIDRGVNTWWRNRALVSGSKITASAANQTLTKTLRSELRQLRRYGGAPKLVLAGSAFIDALELEVAEKGTYTQEGFVKNGTLDIGLADIAMRGVGTIQYDPTLDDLGRSKFAYFIDQKHLFPMVMDGEDMKRHSPARPAEKYVMYRSITWTGGLVSRKMNCHGVYEVA